MTIRELAIELNTTVEELVNYYKGISIDMPNDENFELDYKIAKRAKYNLTIEEFDKYNKNIMEESYGNEADNEIIKLPETEEEFLDLSDGYNSESIKTIKNSKVKSENPHNKYFKKKDEQLINEILIHNQIDRLLLQGVYKKIVGQNFGFFEDIKHENGNLIYYPLTNELIDEIFIPTSELENKKKYIFEVEISRKHIRREKNNPFLIQAKTSNIQEVIELSVLAEKIELRSLELQDLENKLNNSDNLFIEKLQEIETKIAAQKEIKQEEANQIIEEYNNQIISLYDKINLENQNLEKLTENIEKEHSVLNNLNEKRSKMESTIKFLNDKIEICKNLEFLAEDDANKYLNILNSTVQLQTENYLNFETDLNTDFSVLATHVQHYFYFKKNLIYTEFQIKNFLTLLLTNDLVVLSGLSGSGKTQIVKSFVEALGGVAKIIPVKPNWTSSDDLLGYFNPIQSSFLPTPFTEAIVEASLNPHQLYLICLDEMNLARAEYYFADFLSRLEEREKQPEIDLYAKHEEELFISEFKTLLSLIETSIGEVEIKSWNEFLENDKIRNRFFELLGNVEQETMLQIHSKMKKRLIDVLKFPSSLTIPNNVRFIGAINVDETTHYFSPKILDRVHIVKFENPLLIEDIVNDYLQNSNYETELKPVYFNPQNFGNRKELPALKNNEYNEIVEILKEINKTYLLPLSIDFGVRSIRQVLNYLENFQKVSRLEQDLSGYVGLNASIMQKILPRFVFDGNEKTKQDEKKIEVLERLQNFLDEKLSIIWEYELGDYEVGNITQEYLKSMIESAKFNNSQINFFN